MSYLVELWSYHGMTDSHPTPAAPSANPIAPADNEFALASPLETFDPAEYRWVPVRLRPRYDGWTEEKQRRFIEILADTGIVRHAAKEVGMTPETAYRLRRSPHGAAFARAWDAARQHAGCVLEDVAFERAIEGVEHNVYDEYGEVICTKRVHNDRLLTFLLRHLKPERYARDALVRPAPEPVITLEASLREMEPQLPGPAETLMDDDELEMQLQVAEIADGKLPHFYSEQRAPKSAERLNLEKMAAAEARGNALLERLDKKEPGERSQTSHQDMVDITRALDPTSWNETSRKRFK